MGRITRYPPKAKPKQLHEVRVGTEVGRIAGPVGYTRRQPFWACVAIYFDAPEKVDALKHWLSAVDFDGKREAARREPCRVRIAYEKAALGQYAVLWGLSTGVIRDMVQAYMAIYLRSPKGHLGLSSGATAAG
jgi:hypothetical protein